MGCGSSTSLLHEVTNLPVNDFFVANATGKLIWVKSSKDELLLKDLQFETSVGKGGGANIQAGYDLANVGAFIAIEANKKANATFEGGRAVEMGYVPLHPGDALPLKGKYVKIRKENGDVLCDTQESPTGRSLIVKRHKLYGYGVCTSKVLSPTAEAFEYFTDYPMNRNHLDDMLDQSEAGRKMKSNKENERRRIKFGENKNQEVSEVNHRNDETKNVRADFRDFPLPVSSKTWPPADDSVNNDHVTGMINVTEKEKRKANMREKGNKKKRTGENEEGTNKRDQNYNTLEYPRSRARRISVDSAEFDCPMSKFIATTT